MRRTIQTLEARRALATTETDDGIRTVRIYLTVAAVLFWLLFSLLHWVKLPTLVAWQATILSGEYGHLLVWGTLPLLVAIWRFTDGGTRAACVAAALLAAASLLRPAWEASRLRAHLPEGLASAFGQRANTSESIQGTVAVTTQVYREVDGIRLQADVYSIPGYKGRPILVLAHAGGWDSGDRTQLTGMNRRLAEAGIVVVAIDYRLAPGYTWPRQRDDLVAAVIWAKENAEAWGGDPAKVVLWGRSAGGQVALSAAYSRPDLGVRGVVALYAPADLKFAWFDTPGRDVLDSKKLMRQLIGGTPSEADASYEDASPYLQVGLKSVPTLLVHGQADTLVWHQQSVRLADKLRLAGVPAYFLDLPWATHAFDVNADGPGGRLTRQAMEWFVYSVTRDEPGVPGS